jgi:hypothetical protein
VPEQPETTGAPRFEGWGWPDLVPGWHVTIPVKPERESHDETHSTRDEYSQKSFGTEEPNQAEVCRKRRR